MVDLHLNLSFEYSLKCLMYPLLENNDAVLRGGIFSTASQHRVLCFFLCFQNIRLLVVSGSYKLTVCVIFSGFFALWTFNIPAL